MNGILVWGAAMAMLAVAAHCLLQIIRIAGTHGPGLGRQAAHLAMALAMAAMFTGWVSGAWHTVLLAGFLLATAWWAADVVRRRQPASVQLCLSSFAMAVMVWAMTRPAPAGGPSMPGMSAAGSATMSMPGMGMAGPASGDPLRSVLLWVSLALTAGMAVWALRGRRPLDAVMGGAMALMLGSML